MAETEPRPSTQNQRIKTMADEHLEQGESGGEPPPEAVGFKQVDTGGTTNPDLWRYGIEDTRAAALRRTRHVAIRSAPRPC